MTNGGATRARDHVVDIVRLAAMIIVVCMHWCYLHLWMEDGLQLELALSGPVVWALTWLLQAMPAFFVAGGFTNTLLVDRWRASGDPLGAYLGLRARRLTSPVLPLMGSPCSWWWSAGSSPPAWRSPSATRSPTRCGSSRSTCCAPPPRRWRCGPSTAPGGPRRRCCWPPRSAWTCCASGAGSTSPRSTSCSSGCSATSWASATRAAAPSPPRCGSWAWWCSPASPRWWPWWCRVPGSPPTWACGTPR